MKIYCFRVKTVEAENCTAMEKQMAITNHILRKSNANNKHKV